MNPISLTFFEDIEWVFPRDINNLSDADLEAYYINIFGEDSE